MLRLASCKVRTAPYFYLLQVALLPDEASEWAAGGFISGISTQLGGSLCRDTRKPDITPSSIEMRQTGPVMLGVPLWPLLRLSWLGSSVGSLWKLGTYFP